MKLRPNHCPELLRRAVAENARAAIAEDIGGGDPSASLLDGAATGEALIISRDDAVLAGRFWVDEVFRQVNPAISIEWLRQDGERIMPGDAVCAVRGPLAAIVSGERSALNLLQTLSGTATATARHVARIAGAKAVVLDTRKTLPGLRLAQKYAVVCGGGHNHRLDLAGGILIKDNHIRACGSIANAVQRARAQTTDSTHAQTANNASTKAADNPRTQAAGSANTKAADSAHTQATDNRIEVEAETEDEVREALQAGADIILLDNFAPDDIRAMVKLINGRAETEASGNITLDNLSAVAAAGADYISIGALTKHLHAVDFSLQLPPDNPDR